MAHWVLRGCPSSSVLLLGMSNFQKPSCTLHQVDPSWGSIPQVSQRVNIPFTESLNLLPGMINFMCQLVKLWYPVVKSNPSLDVAVKVFLRCDYHLNQTLSKADANQTLSKTNLCLSWGKKREG